MHRGVMLSQFVTVMCCWAAVVGVASAECPLDAYLSPLGCSCVHNRVRCRNITEQKQLQLIMTACDGNELDEFALRNATLDWLPTNLFESINTKEFVLSHSLLRSLTKPDDDATSLFRGSGIQTLALDYTEIVDGDLSHFRDLDTLEQLVIRGFRDTLFVPQVAKLLDGVQLRVLNLEDSLDIVWGQRALDTFDRLNVLSLSGLDLDEVSRKIHLPNQTNHLEHLWLKNNNLATLPPRLLVDMPNLHTIDLSNNNIAVLSENTFALFNGFIALHGNPLECDESVEWLRRRIRDGSIRLLYAQKVTCADGSPLMPAVVAVQLASLKNRAAADQLRQMERLLSSDYF